MNLDEWTHKIRASFRGVTDEEDDAVWAEMVKDGIIDADGNVLKRIPEPPNWLTGRTGRAKTEEAAKSTKKARSRKRA
jgi:hypothetical protein